MTDIGTVATEAQTIIAPDKVYVTDARGRTIVVGKLKALQYYNLTKALGSSSANAATMDLAVIASSVQQIDTHLFAPPRTEIELESLIQILDFDGLQAAGEGLKQLGAKSEGGTEAAKN